LELALGMAPNNIPAPTPAKHKVLAQTS